MNLTHCSTDEIARTFSLRSSTKIWSLFFNRVDSLILSLFSPPAAILIKKHRSKVVRLRVSFREQSRRIVLHNLQCPFLQAGKTITGVDLLFTDELLLTNRLRESIFMRVSNWLPGLVADDAATHCAKTILVKFASQSFFRWLSN